MMLLVSRKLPVEKKKKNIRLSIHASCMDAPKSFAGTLSKPQV